MWGSLSSLDPSRVQFAFDISLQVPVVQKNILVRDMGKEKVRMAGALSKWQAPEMRGKDVRALKTEKESEFCLKGKGIGARSPLLGPEVQPSGGGGRLWGEARLGR